MGQVLFRVPLGDWLPAPLANWLPASLPVYGFGLMLCVAFLLCPWIAGRRAEKEGISRETILDLAVWLFLGGVLGARLNYMLVEGLPVAHFFRIWDGGLVFYGSAMGGFLAYLVVHRLILQKQNISTWKVIDIVAPSLALGLSLGRFGCFLNGCCFGNVATTVGPTVHFPFSSAPVFALVSRGQQTATGFLFETNAMDDRTIGAVEPDSPAALAGLRTGDVLIRADDVPIHRYDDFAMYLLRDWPRGKNDLTLEVQRGTEKITLSPFRPITIGLHPTQLYSSIGAFLLFLLTSAYYPFKRRDGEVMALLMMTYPPLRFLEEALRNDTVLRIQGLTYSQTVSILILLFGAGLFWHLRHQPAQYQPALA